MIGAKVDDKEIQRRLGELDRSVVGEKVALAALSAGKVIGEQWSENINSWPLVKTGTYKRSIHEQVFAEETTDDRVVVIVGTDIVEPPYPLFLEFGTSKMTPKPVGRHALDAKEREARQEFGDAFWELVKRDLGLG